MMKQLALCFMLLFLSKPSVDAHPLKMSVADVVYKDKKLSLKLKLFADDLEMTLRTVCNNGKIDLFNIGFDQATSKCLLAHIKQNFVLKLNGNTLSFKMIKVYLSADTEVAYVEMEAQTPMQIDVKTIFVQNTLMFSNLPEQKSVVNFSWKDLVQTLIIENAKRETCKEIAL